MSTKILALLICFVALAAAAPQVANTIASNDICLLPPMTDATTRCGDYSIRWYYDAQTRDCEDFVYSGCGASENHFTSEWDCERRCEDVYDRIYDSIESVELY